jgi:hypothetical protein
VSQPAIPLTPPLSAVRTNDRHSPFVADARVRLVRTVDKLGVAVTTRRQDARLNSRMIVGSGAGMCEVSAVWTDFSTTEEALDGHRRRK